MNTSFVERTTVVPYNITLILRLYNRYILAKYTFCGRVPNLTHTRHMIYFDKKCVSKQIIFCPLIEHDVWCQHITH